LERYKNDRSRACAFRAVKAFVRWGVSEGLCVDWISGVRPHFAAAPRLPIVTPEEFDRIMAVIPHTQAGRRDRALFTTLYFTGARRDAIRLLRREAVSMADGWISITTKRKQSAYLPLPPPALKALNSWLLHCPSPTCVFPSITNPDKPIDAHCVTHRLPRYAKLAGIARRVHVHLLRHSYATNLVNAGVPLDVVQQALGHASSRMTDYYTVMEGARIRRVSELIVRDELERGRQEQQGRDAR